MQPSPYEIKEKLLQALDHEYNVVDMEAVFDVITSLEKANITRDALEKTRIGKYINELRKRTTNEHLARRAKELVKSWRKLLPQTPQRINGEENSNSIVSSPGGITVLGPGPGPGIGPGPGPGNRSFKACTSVPGTPRYKTTSPIIMVERSSSPYFSSASNSPLLNNVHQGSSLSSLPSNYAPVKLVHCHQISKADINLVSKNLLNSSNQSKNLTSTHNFKPISPSVFKQDIVTSSGTCGLPSRTSLNASPGLKNNSNSSSPLFIEAFSHNASPISSFSLTYSSLDLSKTNVANKRLRKEINFSNYAPSTESVLSDSIHSKITIDNGMSDVTENNLPSENSAFCSVSSSNSNSVEGDKTLLVSSPRIPKRKRSFDNELQENRLGDMIATMHSGSKLSKVKTTQQLIADLQAKKGFNAVLSPDSLKAVDALHSSEAEVSRTKSELLKKFLLASQSVQSESNRDSPVDESSVSLSDYCSHSVPDVSSVINTNLNISSSISHPDPVDEEIKRILSDLPPLNPTEINLEDDDSTLNHSSSIITDLSKLEERWEYVNGVYDCNGTWRPWQECTEQKSYLEESFQILPYVNID